MGLTLDTRVLKKFKHRLVVCSQDDVVVDAGEMSLSRKGVYEGWAAITPRRSSTWSEQGNAVMDPANLRSHIIIMRYRADVDITSFAWLYEKQLKSPPRWFKILTVVDENENSEYFKFECHLVEKGEDNIVTPEGRKMDIASPLPHGVSL